MLTWLQVFNKLDVAYDQRLTSLGGLFPLPVHGDFIYQDEASGISLDIDGVNLTEADSHYIRFGGEASDFLVGGMLSDRLFGGAGRDILSGFRGDDYLEGNGGDDTLYGNAGSDMLLGGEGGDTLDGGEDADVLYGGAGADTLNGGTGSDILYGDFGADDPDAPPTLMAASATSGSGSDDRLNGGEGADTLHGGAGNDILDGGEGNDTLTGGAGLDVYTVEADSGRDTVIDSDGRGRIWLAGREILGGGELQAETDASAVWVDDSDEGHPITYRLDRNTNELSITGHGSTVLVRDYETGDLGITIPAAPPAPPPATADNNVDLTYPENGIFEWSADSDSVDEPYHLRNAAVAFSSLDSEWEDWNGPAMTGLAHIHRVVVGGLNAGDLIEGGPGEPVHRVAIRGARGDDRVFAGTETTLQAAVAAGESDPASGTGWLWLDGGEGDDLLVGGAGNDLLTGGTGDDAISGGAGSDVISADFGGVPTQFFNHPGIGAIDDPGTSPYLPWFAIPSEAGALPLLPTMILRAASQETDAVSSGGAGILTRFVPVTLDPMASLDLSGLYAMQREALPAIERELVEHRRTYGDLNGPGWNGYGTPNGPAGGNDVVYAGSGNDVVNAGGGDDTVYAGTGNDIVAGYDGQDHIAGGAGDDRLQGDYTSAREEGLPATQTITILGAQIVVHHTLDASRHGNDYLDGGAGGDIVLGNGADDNLRGGEGDDQLYGDEGIAMGQYSGDDAVDGGTGDDQVFGGGGSDQLAGSEGNDALLGDWSDDGAQYSGRDTLDGGAGDDEMLGGGSDDRLLGGTGDDALWGDGTELEEANSNSYGSDVLDGGEGSDYLQGDGGADVLLGGAGNDTLFGDDDESRLGLAHHGADRLDGGAGDDYLDGQGGDDQLDGGEGSDELRGGQGNDHLQGGADRDALLGGDGDDVLDGGSGDDSLRGGAGSNVYLFGRGDGQDTLGGFGETVDGVNTLRFEGGVAPADVEVRRVGSNLRIQLSGSTDQVLVNGFFSGDNPAGGSNPLQRIEFADGTVWGLGHIVEMTTTGGGDNDELYGTVLGNVMRGYGGSDLLFGLAGNDHIEGGAEGDLLDGGVGDDWLQGGAGDDDLRGGTGNDTYAYGVGDGEDVLVDYEGDNAIQFGPGVAAADLNIRVSDQDYDRLSLALVQGGSITVVTPKAGAGYSDFIRMMDLPNLIFANGESWDRQRVYEEALKGTAEADSLTGFMDDDLIDGQAGDDVISGSAGNDTLRGGAGNDRLLGTWGSDRLEGGDGDDYLNDDDGDNVLDGGAGDDVLSTDWGNSTYLFGKGDGHDTIGVEFGRGGGGVHNNTLQFKQGVKPEDLILTRSTSDSGNLEIAIDGTGDRVSVLQFFRGDSNPVQQLRFADGTTWDIDRMLQAVDAAPADRVLVGSDGGDELIGGRGNDQLNGGAGDDLLSGGSGQDTLYGDEGSDVLDGGEGSDFLYGGVGSDTYLIAAQGQDIDYLADMAQVDEAYGGEPGDAGRDAVQFGEGVTLADLSYRWNSVSAAGEQYQTLELFHQGREFLQIDYRSDRSTDPQGAGVGVESFVFSDGTALDVDALLSQLPQKVPNSVMGTVDSDRLVGSPGLDVLIGLAGDDSYFVQDPGDQVVELSGEGYDTVYADVDYALPQNVEELYLSGGGSAVVGTGNDLDNWIIGNELANVLSGGEGNDSYDAYGGDDVIIDTSLTSNEVYNWYDWEGNDRIFDAGGIDELWIWSQSDASMLSFGRTGDDLTVTVDGGSDNVLRVSDWYAGNEHRIESLRLNEEIIDVPEPSTSEVGLGSSSTTVSLAVAHIGNTSSASSPPLLALVPEHGVAVSGTSNALDNLLFGTGAVNVLMNNIARDVYEDGDASGFSWAMRRELEEPQAGVGSLGWARLDAWTSLQAAMNLLGSRPAGLATPLPLPDHQADEPLAMMALGAGGRVPEWRRDQPMQMLR